MSPENENILKEHIEILQRSIQDMVSHIADMTITINGNTGGCSDIVTQFYGEQNVSIYLPFSLNPGADVQVIVEEAPGMYREITPIIQYNGSTVVVTFDRKYSGTVTIPNPISMGMMLPPVPPHIQGFNPISLYEPAYEPPIVEETPTEIFPTQGRSITEIVKTQAGAIK